MKVSIQFKNAEEFQQLLERAVTLVEQLQETLQRINEFKLELKVDSQMYEQPKIYTKIDAKEFIDKMAKNLFDSMSHYHKYLHTNNKREQAFNDLVTYICKQCQEHGFTLKELEKIPALVQKFYYDNAIPYRDKRG
jgi:hypothetical protein